MTTGTIATIVIAAVIGFFFLLGICSIVRKFSSSAGECGSCGGNCAACQKGINDTPVKKR